MTAFNQLLQEAKDIGVQAVTIDVWWGKVEAAGDQTFDWSYYDAVFNAIRGKGLKIIPIMSFHRCGGGPGDNCDIPLPSWLFSHFGGAGLSADDLGFESERCVAGDVGNKIADAIAPWATATPAVLDEYRELMDAFESQFGSFAGDFVELNVSLGPTGELRYPAYNGEDGWSFPDRGNFQAYSRLAREGFRDFALTVSGSSSGNLGPLNARWGTTLSNTDQIRPPGGEMGEGAQPCPVGVRRAQSFVDLNDHIDTAYGVDFISFLALSLVDHGRRVLTEAHSAFSGPMASIPLGMKIPGVHWQMQACSPRPRIAEVTAGLVQTSLNLNAESAARADAFGYKAILDMIADVKNTTGREVILHFTAVEMDNDPTCGNGNSMAEALVFWISHGAEDRGIAHKAENALACVNQTGDDRTWESIRNVFTHAPYSGLSLLRLSSSGCNPWSTDKGRYQEFIQDFVGATKPELIVHVAEWESCIEPACRYNVHTFAGEMGTFALSHEDEFNGRHWWIGTVPQAADFFQFTFNNTNGWEGSPGSFDRTYARGSHGNEIFLLGREDTIVRTTRP